MKFISIILIAYFSLLTISPALCGMNAVLKQENLCSTDNSMQGSREQSDNNKQSGKSESNSPCIPCCSIQNCHTYFIAIPKVDLIVQISATAILIPFKSDKKNSIYLSDCWRPPKIV